MMTSYQKSIKPFGLKLKNIELNTLPVYDDRSIKTKIRTNDDKVYINFHSLNAPEDRGEYELFTIISIDSILAFENKYYLQEYLDNCSQKSIDKQKMDVMIDLDDHLFDSDSNSAIYDIL